MAVKNALQQRKSAAATTYEAGGSQITLTPDIVRKYLVSGSGNVTDQEIAMFISLCRYSHLNPWVHEAYCIKYGSSPATMVVSKEAFQKRAETNPAYNGAASGIVVEDDQTGEVIYRVGTLKRPGETVIGGWAEVYRKDRTHSTRVEVSLDEYIGHKSDGSVTSMWASKPATMIRKVALAQALREAFPSAFGGMYTAEEQGAAEPEMTAVPISPEESPQEAAKAIEAPKEQAPKAPEMAPEAEEALFS